MKTTFKNALQPEDQNAWRSIAYNTFRSQYVLRHNPPKFFDTLDEAVAARDHRRAKNEGAA